MQREMESCLKTYQPLRIKTYQDLQLMETVIAEGAEQARHVVRLGAKR